MYKKILCCIGLISILFVLSSCGNSTDSTSKINTSKQTDITKDSQAKNDTQNQTIVTNQKNKENSISNNNDSSLEIIINDQTKNSIGTYNIGMTKKNVIEMIKTRNMKILLDDDNGTAGSTIICDYINFYFDTNDILYEIYVYNVKNFQTSKGLKYGDSIERLTALYGNEFSSHDEPDVTVLEYKFSTGFFRAVLNSENKVEGWGVLSKNSIGKNQKSSPDASDTLEVNKKAIKNQLLSEFKSYLHKVKSGDKSEYNFIMASDRANGLNSMFSLTEEENTLVKSNYMGVMAPLEYSVVYNGYSADGVHFIAIISQGSVENSAYMNAVNKIREKEDEFDFLSYILNVSPERSLYMGVDIYAEDLSGKNQVIKLDGITLSNTDGESVEKPIFGDHVNKILSKYNRQTTEEVTFEDKNWYTFVFDGTLIYQPEIVIEYNNKNIVLQK
ncbi:MAG: hypothetical protein K0R50_2764 [Eubacterium sp.]|jgi:hypothetical protein|nr:hypothetical protein [Eubacterium sp.]